MNLIEARNMLMKGHNVYEMNLNVVYYARVSTEKDEQLNSLENQKNYFEELINDCPNWNLVGSYIDEGISGTSAKKRESFLKMINDGTEGKFDMVLTKEVSRFARNTVDSIKYTQTLLKHGVVVDFINDNINTINLDSEFRLTLMSSMAQDEVRKLSERVKFGLKRSVKDGKVLGGGNILGYNKSKGKLYINEDEAKMIRIVFELYATGEYGFTMIGSELRKKGYLSSAGKNYSESTLRRIINNPKYKGYYCANKSYIEDYKTHKKINLPESEWIVYKDDNIPAIVSTELWNKVNNLYKKRKSEFKKTISPKNYYLLDNKYTGKLICKEHGTKFVRRGSGHRKNNPSWLCSNYAKNGLNGCVSPIMSEKDLDKIFRNVIFDFMSNKDEYLKELVECYTKFIKSNLSDDTNEQIDMKIKNLDIKKDKLLDLCVIGNVTNEEFKIRNDKLNDEINKLQEQKRDIKTSRNKIKEYKKQIKLIEDKLEELLDIDNNYSKLFNLIVKKVIVEKINNDRRNIKLTIIFYHTDIPLEIKDIFLK